MFRERLSGRFGRDIGKVTFFREQRLLLRGFKFAQCAPERINMTGGHVTTPERHR
jgi:hypothetical protein